MSKKTKLNVAVGLAGLMALTGCGGGGGQTDSPVSGRLMDGYIKGGLVCLDTNRNLRCDAGEPATITGSGGQFTLYPLKNTSLAGLFLVAEIGSTTEDSDAPGQPMAATRMLGFAEKPAVVSPLTTVVASMVHSGDSLSEAEARARTLLGLSSAIDFSTDYIATDDTDTHVLAQAVNIVATVVVGNSTINPTQFLEALASVKDDLRKSATDLRAALSRYFDKDDILVGDFDDTKPSFGAIGGAEAAVAAAPTGGSGDALRLVRVAGSEPFAGAAIDLAAGISGSQYYTVSARVHVVEQAAGKSVKLKLESADGSAQSEELESREAVVSGWQTLTWIFNTSPDRTYNKLIVLPNVGTAGAGETYYLDAVNLYKGKVLANFDALTPGFFGSNGSADVAIDTAPTGGAGKALKIVKNPSDGWAGAVVNLDAPLRNATAYTVTARVWSPSAGIPMTMKLESFEFPSDRFVQASAKEPVVQGWQTLTWEFTGATDWWWLEKMFFQPADGLQGNGEAYFIDDIKVRTTAIRLGNFDDLVPSWYGSSGSAIVSSDTGPDGGAGNAMKVVKNPSDTWAGAAINLDWIIRGATSYTLTARVYSPTAGAPMVLKLVDLNDETRSVQATSKQPVAVGWQSLTWEFTDAQDWWWLNKLYFQPNDGVAGAGEAYYLDDIVQLTK